MVDKKNFKILVVDDEKSNITALAHILMPIYDVLVAKDGPSAIEVAKNSKPDLILLDIIMPDMSGFEVLTELKNSDATREIPVIFITGLNSSQDEEKGLRLGAVDYITKPFHDSIVKLRVRTHLKIIEQMRTIERLGMIDALTNIPNRRGFNNQFNLEWNRAVRNRTSLGMLMLDIDQFKLYNDSYGHAHGDMALKMIADIISQTLKRTTDFVARWGGEEFAVLLPDTDLNGVLEVAEQIRAKVEDAAIPCPDGKNSKLTISIGVYHESSSTIGSADLFISEADKALYDAKAAGRNKVMQAKI